MDNEYGQKAPALPDGSLLIQELRLTPDQTQQMAAEKKAILDDYKKVMAKSALLILSCLALNAAVLITLIVTGVMAVASGSALNPVLMYSLLGAVALLYFADKPVKKACEKMFTKSALRVIEMVGESKVEPVIFPLVSRYMAGDKKARVKTYMSLIMHGETLLGSSKVNKLRLDSADDESYIVREVIVS